MPGPEAKVRVLLVDDETDYLASLSRVLARRGFSVVTAASGEDALAALRGKPVDVAVVDVKMPGIDGLELLSLVKSMRPEVEVILLTGHATVESAIRGMQEGAFDYLFKPHEPDALAQKILAAADKKAGARKAE